MISSVSSCEASSKMPPPDRMQPQSVQHSRRLLALSNKPADVMFSASAFAGIADALKTQPGAKRFKAYIVRSVTVEPILPFLADEAVLSNFVLDLQIGGYGSYADEMLNSQSALAKFKPDVIFILLDLEDIAGRLPDLCADGIGNGVEAGDRRVSVPRIAQLLKRFSRRQLRPNPLSGMRRSRPDLPRRRRRGKSAAQSHPRRAAA